MSRSPLQRAGTYERRGPLGLEAAFRGLGRRWLTDWPRRSWDLPVIVPSLKASRWIFALALAVAFVNLAIVIWADLDWVWADGRARLTIARSVIDNKQPGFTQFGNTWLPLHPAAMLPLVWIDWAYRSGAAGILVSTLSLAVCLFYTHRFVFVLTRSMGGAFVAAVALVLSPNFMFMAGTPMSETPFAALTMAAWYYLVLWTRDPSKARALTLAGLCVGAGAMIRYEAWFFVPAGAAFMVLSRIQREKPTPFWQTRMEGELLAFVSLAVFPVFLFIVYNWLIFDQPDAFLRNNEQAVLEQAIGLNLAGNLSNTTRVLGWTILDNIGYLAAATAAVGFAVFVFVGRRPVVWIAMLLPAVSAAFFFYSIYSGGSVLRHDRVYEGYTLLNARYGVIAIPAAAVAIGVLGSFGRLPALAALAALGLQFGMFMLSPQPVITVRDATQSGYRHFEATARAFDEVYDGGDVLMAFRDHAQMLPAIHLHLDQVIHEGISQVSPTWEDALADPAAYVRWIVVRENGQGKLDQLIPAILLERDFEVVREIQLDNPYFVERIYRIRPGVNRTVPAR
ncbi:MAG: hypothetical protein CVU47_08140 [Chloroflexi bacterium HGW-Chloroflexi-9]|nr:MAG: hypothetical protein CVU47_08140 [Chloroflexi bacterium HGW-Chloroflexi-9]